MISFLKGVQLAKGVYTVVEEKLNKVIPVQKMTQITNDSAWGYNVLLGWQAITDFISADTTYKFNWYAKGESYPVVEAECEKANIQQWEIYANQGYGHSMEIEAGRLEKIAQHINKHPVTRHQKLKNSKVSWGPGGLSPMYKLI